MRKHLDGCTKYKMVECENQSGQDLFADFFSSAGRPTLGLMTDDKLCEQVLRIITEGNLSFSQAENVELTALLKHAYPGVSIPNRHSVTVRLESNVTTAKEDLKTQLKELDSKISLALDVWTTRNNIAFLGMFTTKIPQFALHPITVLA